MNVSHVLIVHCTVSFSNVKVAAFLPPYLSGSHRVSLAMKCHEALAVIIFPYCTLVFSKENILEISTIIIASRNASKMLNDLRSSLIHIYIYIYIFRGVMKERQESKDTTKLEK